MHKIRTKKIIKFYEHIFRVTPLGPNGFLFANTFVINMYTASGWSNVLLGAINFFMFLPCFFKDHRIAAKEQMILQNKTSEKDTWKNTRVDFASSFTLILSFFVIVFNFVLLGKTLVPKIFRSNLIFSSSEQKL